MLGDLIRYLRKKTNIPLILKLSPNVTDIVEMAKRAEGEGADALSLINTLRGLSVDPETRRPRLSTVIGGLSGPAVKPVALRMVWEVSSAVRIPVIGIGGILQPEDAVEFLICGATAVQVGTAQFRDPLACARIIRGLEEYMERHQVEDVRELIGSMDVDHVSRPD
jgi:dihydroorotate dehydrogenase (NAD+) catalytic subunit